MISIVYAFMMPLILLQIISIGHSVLYFVILAELSVASIDIAGRMRAGHQYEAALQDSYYTKSPFSTFCRRADGANGYEIIIHEASAGNDDYRMISASCDYILTSIGVLVFFGDVFPAHNMQRSTLLELMPASQTGPQAAHDGSEADIEASSEEEITPCQNASDSALNNGLSDRCDRT